MKAGLTGMIAVGRDEMVYSTQSLGYTTVIAVIAILILLMISFRMWVAPIFAIANLLVGLVWAVGTAAIVVEQLNIMTQMMAVILLGLGIDFKKVPVRGGPISTTYELVRPETSPFGALTTQPCLLYY